MARVPALARADRIGFELLEFDGNRAPHENPSPRLPGGRFIEW